MVRELIFLSREGINRGKDLVHEIINATRYSFADLLNKIKEILSIQGIRMSRINSGMFGVP